MICLQNWIIRLRPVQRASSAPRPHDAGVTLIEMMVVLVMISVVAAVIVPNVIGRPDEARITVAQTDLKSIAGALELYRLDNRRYPTTSQGLAALAVRPITAPVPQSWPQGGYLITLPVDPWGNEYVYRSPGQSSGQSRGFDLVSLGADGALGGSGVEADISLAGVSATDRTGG